MSTWTSIEKAIPKRKYRERSQPAARKKRGLLEKHKDYKLRADDYHRKEKRMQKLMTKARLRNPDEFYFKMVNSKMENGKHMATNPDEMADDDDEEKEREYKKIKITQGENAIKLRKYRDHKKVESLKSELHMINFPKKNTHQIFVENEEEFKNFDPVEYFDTVPELLHNRSNRLRKHQLENIDLNKSNQNASKIGQRMKTSYKRLADKIKNEETMKEFYVKLDFEKQLLGKEKVRTKQLAGGEKEYKFFQERKR